ncbi:MAG: translation initiation factor IF-3 [Phycisphaerae bacterium]|nr:translation initiation factor IF-3 [Phycisphaerae bacterium]
MRRNEQIRISPVRVIGEAGEQLGVMPVNEAMRMAHEAGMDLVEVAPNVRPPVCRIMDYGKWKYLQKKKTKKSHEQALKEVRLRPKTDDHDRGIKLRQAEKFLKAGDKVQFTMRFRGRERAHREIAFSSLREIADQLGEKVKVERPPSMDGRNMIMILSPVKGAWGEGEAAEDEHSSPERPAVVRPPEARPPQDHVPAPQTMSATTAAEEA